MNQLREPLHWKMDTVPLGRFISLRLSVCAHAPALPCEHVRCAAVWLTCPRKPFRLWLPILLGTHLVLSSFVRSPNLNGLDNLSRLDAGCQEEMFTRRICVSQSRCQGLLR